MKLRPSFVGLPLIRCFLSAAFLTSTLVAADTPAPPASPLNSLVRQLAARRPAPANAVAKPVDRAALLLPEFRFKPAANWLLLPDLANGLGTNQEERAAVLQLLDAGTREAKKLLAAEGGDNDVAAATALFMSQLWQFARATELPAENIDALHAQIVGVFRGDAVAKMSDADKQRYWEFCIGYPIFIAGMAEVIEGEAQKADLRAAAAIGFETLIGVKPDLVDIGPQGLVVRAGLEAAMHDSPPAKEKSLAPARDTPTAITYTPPPGWKREELGWATGFRATLGDVRDDGRLDATGSGQHPCSIFILPPRAMTRDAHTTFDALWREQFDTFTLGDTIVHYRTRIKCGLVVHYMGRFFHRKSDPDNALQNYAVLYLVDLGGDRVQPIVAIAVPNDSSMGMGSFKETAAYRALSWPLAALLDSIQPASGAAPYPAGGYFAPRDFHGRWTQSSSAFGGFYTNTYTGASAGVATHASGGHLYLTPEGTYDYAFAYSTVNPQFGNSAGSEKQSGRYRLDGDILLTEPAKLVGYPLKRCAAGIGTRQTSNGVKRILVLVGADGSGVFRAPPVIPNGDSYTGVMDWYVEE